MTAPRSISGAWRYTLTRNEWLNLPTRRYGMFVWKAPDPKGVNTVYDFTIWKGRERVASWCGTESEAFGAMLHLAARDDRSARYAAMEALLRGGNNRPVGEPTEIAETAMEDRVGSGDGIPAATTMWLRLLDTARAEMQQQGSYPDPVALLRVLLSELRTPTHEMIEEAIERAGLNDDGDDILAADVFRRGYQGAIDVILMLAGEGDQVETGGR